MQLLNQDQTLCCWASGRICGTKACLFAVQVSFAFRHIEGALNYFVDNLDKFSGLAAQSERLDALLTGIVSGAESAAALH